MATGDVYRLAALGRIRGELMVNIHTYRQEVVQTDPMQALSDFMEDLFTSAAGLWTNQFAWEQFQIRNLSTPTEGQDFAVTIIGTATGDDAPLTAAAILSWRTGLIGRAFRGRTYLPGLPESYGAGSNITGSYLAALQGTADAMIVFQFVGVDVFRRVVVTNTTVPFTATPVVSAVVPTILGSMRKRRPGVGA